MASDDSRPKIRMLLTIGIVSVCILVGIKFVLDSYYYSMTEDYERTLLPKPELLQKTREQQLEAVNGGQNGAIPVSVAMQTLASKGRDNASPDITPQPSDDIDALKGWTKLKRDVHLPPQNLQPTATEAMDAGADAAPSDAGMTSDAAIPTMAGDAGMHAARDGGH